MHFSVLKNSGVLPTVDTRNNLNECPGNYSEWKNANPKRLSSA